MHELSLCQNAVELITQQVAKHNVKRVTAVWFEVGALACVEEDALRFGFDCASRGTILEGAAVHITTVDANAWCWDCNRSVSVPGFESQCPLCNGHNLRMNDDNALTVKEVEVE